MLSEWSVTVMIMWLHNVKNHIFFGAWLSPEFTLYLYGFYSKRFGLKQAFCVFWVGFQCTENLISFLLSVMQQSVIWTVFMPHADAGVTRTDYRINMQPSCFRTIFTDSCTGDFLRKLNTKILFCMVQNKLHASKMLKKTTDSCSVHIMRLVETSLS